MKSKVLMSFMLVFCIVAIGNAQQKKIKEEQVPKVVYSAFGQQYPDATVVQWEVPECDCYEDWVGAWETEMSAEYPQEYEDPDAFYVTFKYKNDERRSIFYKNGQWMQTRSKINKERLPKPILAAVQESEYRDWEIADNAFIIETPTVDGKVDLYYKVYLKGGIKRHVLRVGVDGRPIPKSTLFE